MSEKLLSDIDLKKHLNLISVDKGIYNINIREKLDANEDNSKKSLNDLPEIKATQLKFPSQDDLVKNLNTYYTTSNDLFKKSEAVPDKTDLEDLKNKKRDDNSIVGFNKIKFDKINDQIKALTNNNTLEVLKDSFNESIEVTNPIHIIANPTASVNCNTKNDTLTCRSYNVIFENFTFNYRGQDSYSAARIVSGNATFINCNFSSSKSFAVRVENSSRATFIDCEFTNSPESNIIVAGNALVTLIKCRISGASKNGIELTGKSAAEVHECDIRNSTIGVSIDNNSSAFFEKCKINTNSEGGFKITSKSDNIILQNNDISKQLEGYGISADNSKIILISNTIGDNHGGAIVADNCSTITTSNNKIFNIDPISDSGFVFIKKSSKVTSKNDTYEGSAKQAIEIRDKDSEFIGSNITIKNNMLGSGIMVCPRSNLNISNSHFENISYAGVVTPKTDAKKNSCNISVQNCKFISTTDQSDDQHKVIGVQINDKSIATVEDCIFSKMKKAVTLVTSIDKVLIKNCTFENSIVNAITVSSSANAVFENCKTKNNIIAPSCNLSISGKGPADEKPVRFVDCTFKLSTAQNVSISKEASAEFDGCSFEQSVKQSVEVRGSSQTSFNNCSFTNNRYVGLLVIGKSSATVENSRFYANSQNGFVCQEKGSSITLRYSKIYDHTRSGGGTILGYAKGVIDHCEFYNNILRNFEVSDFGEAEVNNSNLHTSGGSMASIYVWKNGNLKMDSSNIYNENTTAIYIHYNGIVSLTKCNIYDCLQGGIMIGQKGDLAHKEESAKSSLTLKECVLRNNHPYGVVYMFGTLNIEKCRFEQNSSAGIGKFEDIKNFTIDSSNQFIGSEQVKTIKK